MKQLLVVLATALLAATFSTGVRAADDAGNPPAKALATELEQFSYAIGLEIGTSLKSVAPDINVGILMQAIEDQLQGKEPLMTMKDAVQVKTARFRKIREAAASKNSEAGKMFLEENKKKEGVLTTESGLQYQVLTAGAGPKPKATDTVKVHYRGTLIDGTEFDSSYSRGQPATFAANRVIPGWTEALQLMPVGSKYRLFIPADLGYGERGAPPKIGPNATLVFEVELLEIQASKTN